MAPVTPASIQAAKDAQAKERHEVNAALKDTSLRITEDGRIVDTKTAHK